MKAAILKAFGSPFCVETVPNPVLKTGEIIVNVVADAVPLCGVHQRTPSRSSPI